MGYRMHCRDGVIAVQLRLHNRGGRNEEKDVFVRESRIVTSSLQRPQAADRRARS